VVSVALADGSRRWQVDLPDPADLAPVVVDWTVYLDVDAEAYGESDALLALDAADGSERWDNDPDESIFASRVVVGGTVYPRGTPSYTPSTRTDRPPAFAGRPRPLRWPTT
jgi:outer membrane protein assembly factor BamB